MAPDPDIEPPQPDSPFRLVANPAADPAWLNAAVAGLPPAALAGGGPPLFPPAKHVGACRICGRVTELTEEHLPPRGAFNKQRHQEVPVDEVLGADDLDPEGGGRILQGGIRGYMLCGDCNGFTGRWGREYQGWAGRAFRMIASTGKAPADIDETDGYPYIAAAFLNVYPGRFIRQVLSMMLSISGSPELGERYPQLRELVLGGPPRQLPDPLRVYLNLYAHHVSRIAGGRAGQGRFDADQGVWRWLLEVSFVPLSTILVINGPPDPELGLDITSFTECDPDVKSAEIDFEGLRIGFGHKPFPGDFRTKGQLLAQRDTADSDLENEQ